MSSLPHPPDHLSYDDVRLEFLRLTEADADRGFVPAYHFRIVDPDGIDLGHINIRVGDTEHIRLAAGHIGYTILEPHRGNGYAAKACLAAGPWVAELMGSATITSDPDNIPSIRTIEKIGAEFIDEVDVPKNDPHFERGSTRKRRFVWNPE